MMGDRWGPEMAGMTMGPEVIQVVAEEAVAVTGLTTGATAMGPSWL